MQVTSANGGVMQEAAAPPAAAGGLTIRADTLLWLALIAAAAVLRLARLDALPFTFEESARALDALRVSQNNVPEGWNGDLAAVVTSYLFRAFEGSELVARVAPAVAGSVMVAAVWLGGRGLGRVGALTAGALLAFSPLALLLSRSALPFSFGGLLAVAMVVALLSYLREPRAHTAFLFAAAFGLAFSADAVAMTAAIAVAAFLLLEPIVAREGAVARAWGVFRRSPSHWLSVLLVLAAAAELGVTHFVTFLDLSQPAGLALWRDMFALPRDGREPEYQVALLLAYDWPILLAGGTGVVFFAQRLARRGVSAHPRGVAGARCAVRVSVAGEAYPPTGRGGGGKCVGLGYGQSECRQARGAGSDQRRWLWPLQRRGRRTVQ